MQEKIKAIASRVKEMRELSKHSVEEMASHLKIQVDKYSAYESGQEDIPASILVEIAQKFGIETSVLLTGEQPSNEYFYGNPCGKGVSVERRRDYKYQSLAQNFIHKKAEPFLVTVDPKDEGAAISRNSHPGQEFDYLLEGRLKVIVRNNEMILEPGDSIYFDSSYEHGMIAIGEKPATFLAIIF